MSAIRFPTIRRTLEITREPITTYKSCDKTASKMSLPIPGHLVIISTRALPERIEESWNPNMVIIGFIAFLKVCLYKMLFSDNPFALDAVI